MMLVNVRARRRVVSADPERPALQINPFFAALAAAVKLHHPATDAKRQ
jgi:hypothetical protein